MLCFLQLQPICFACLRNYTSVPTDWFLKSGRTTERKQQIWEHVNSTVQSLPFILQQTGVALPITQHVLHTQPYVFTLPSRCCAFGFGVHKIHSEEKHLLQTLQGIWWIDYSDKGGKDCIKTSADLPHEKGEQNQPGHWHPCKVSSNLYTSMSRRSEQTTNTWKLDFWLIMRNGM